jgi:hypothetical protein
MMTKDKKFKQIKTSPILESQKEPLILALDDLKGLKAEILEKQAHITNKSSILIDGYSKMSSNKTIKMNTDVKDTFEKSSQHFVSLSNLLCGEIDHHVSFYERHMLEGAPKEVTIEHDDPDSFENYINKGIKLMKAYTKNRKKEISVIFSRYDHGLTAQLRKFETLQLMLQNMKSTQKENQNETAQIEQSS